MSLRTFYSEACGYDSSTIDRPGLQIAFWQLYGAAFAVLNFLVDYKCLSFGQGPFKQLCPVAGWKDQVL